MSTDLAGSSAAGPGDPDGLVAAPPPVPATDRSPLDRLARRVLLVEGRDPRALLSMRTSLVVSAVRCVITYALIPVLLPLAGWLAPVARPVSLLLSVVAVVFAVRSLRRVWLADWSGRWGYTAFAVVVLVVLGGLIAYDVAALVG